MAIDVNLGLSAAATGTVDVITATYSPAPTLVDRKILFLRTAGTNTTTTPTFNPNSLGAKTIVKQGGAALVAGDLVGDAILMYNATSTQWELLNPRVRNVGTTAGTVLEGNAARYMTINFAMNIVNPADSTTYYVGRSSFATPTTVDTDHSFKTNIAGTIVKIVMQVGKSSGGTTGSTENCTAAIKNITTATSSASFGDFLTNVGALNSKDANLGGTTMVVAATDDIAIEITTPAWSTNPTNLRIGGYILIKLD